MKKLFVFILLLIFFTACDDDPHDVDTSGVELEVDILRMEKALFSIAPDSITDREIEGWAKNYQPFFRRYINNIVTLGDLDDPALAYYIQNFTGDKDMREVYRETEKEFPTLGHVEKDLSDAFKRYKVHFPGKPVPKFFSFISGFNYSIVTDDSVLALGLDMYLGSDCEFYRFLGIPEYRKKTMEKRYLVPDAVRGWMQSEYPRSDSTASTMLREMIHAGKLIYAADALLPGIPDHLKVRYTQDELEWCEDNEADVWFHFVDRDLLYVQKTKTIVKYMKDAPFTPGFPQGSPGRIGEWIGWRVVEEYMQRHPEISLKELLEIDDAQHILQNSKYKPDR